MKLRFCILFETLLITLLFALNLRAQWELAPSFPAAPKATIGPYIFASCGNGLWVSGDSGTDWDEVDSGLGRSPYIGEIVRQGTRLFALESFFGVFSSTDSGRSWTADSAGLSGASFNDLAAEGSRLLIGSNSGLYSSSDSGSSWTVATRVGVDNNVSRIAVNNDYLFALVDDVYRSKDNGATWEPANVGGGVINLTAFNGCLFAGTFGAGIYRSTNDGTSWTKVDSGLSNLFVNVIKGFGSIVFAGTDGGGVFISTNNGLTWRSSNSGIQDTLANQIVYFGESDGYVYVQTEDGVWRRPLSEFANSAISEPPTISSNIQSFPNPFTQSTTIRFTASASGEAEVTVVNLLGTEVAHLYSGELTQGPHSFTWDAGGMAPGMYECIVRMDDIVQRVPLMLSR